VVLEDGPTFLTIQVQPTLMQPTLRMYTYPVRDVDAGEFIVYVKES